MEDGYDGDDIDNSKSKSGVGVCTNINTLNSGVGKGPTINEDTEEGKFEMPQGLDLDFGDAPYWSNGIIAKNVESYMLSVIATFSNMNRLRSTS